MKTYKKIHFITGCLVVLSVGCTKLDQNLNSSLTSTQAANALGANGTALLLQTAYTDIGTPFSDPGNIFGLEEVTTDECLVPTRGGDWDDNGKWRALHQHTWSVDGVDIFLSQFNALNKVNFDATNVLAFKPSTVQAAEARFLRALALYQLLDLFGQFPFRNPGDNLLNAPKVYSGDSAISFIISELTAIQGQLSSSVAANVASPDAVRFLLMRCYLNKGAFLNRTTPTFADADMQQVIKLGGEIMANTKYGYTSNYFDNFSVDNSIKSREGIFAYANQSGVTTNNSGIHNRWWATLHYNQGLPGANSIGGWNGFSTVAEFYNSFGITTAPTSTPADTALDKRLGGRYYSGATNVSGIRPGILIGQQYDANNVPLKDRKSNPLSYTPAIATDLKETGANLEITGLRAVKYVPDYTSNNSNYGNSKAGNWLMLFRYADVALMVAEAKMRATAPDVAGALKLVNDLRAARGAAALTAMPLVDVNNVYAPSTLLAERGRELYWEGVRRTDLIRFGVFTKAWAYKPASNAKYLVFPIPSAALAANPNLKQNNSY